MATDSKRILSLLIAIALICVSARSVAAGPAPAFVYTLTRVIGGSNQIHGFTFDRSTGTLSALPGFPVPSGGSAEMTYESEQMVYAAGRLVVLNDGSNTLSVFAVNQSSGTLTPLPYSPVALGSGKWRAVALHPIGSLVVVGEQGANRVASFVLTATSATAAAGSPLYTGTGASASSIAFSRDGAYVYTGGDGGDSVAGFKVAATGVLTPLPGSPFATGAPAPMSLATDRAGRLFLENNSLGLIRAYTTSAGVPTPVPGSPFATGISSLYGRGVVHPAGFYIRGDQVRDRVCVYRITGSGAATSVAPASGSPYLTGGLDTGTIALSQDGRFVIVGNSFTRNLTVFQMTMSTGALTSLSTQPPNTLGAAGFVSGLVLVPRAVPGDFDDDARADVGVYRPSTGEWWVGLSAIEYTGFVAPWWGIAADKIVPGDYDGDGKTDFAVYRPSDGGWYVVQSSTDYATWFFRIWGTATDIPVPADFDGDGKTDMVFYRPSTGQWFVKQSSTGFTTDVSYTWGAPGDVPVPGQYDSDYRADPAVYRPSTSTWHILKSTTGYDPDMASSYWSYLSGTVTTVPGDYDGDGNTDLGTYRPSTGSWNVLLSSAGYIGSLISTWGIGADIPVPGDYDGDGKVDVAIYRPSSGVWFVIASFNDYAAFWAATWGIPGDIPILGRP